MQRKIEFWKLYENTAYDEEYKRIRQLDSNVKQIFNPVQNIIDLDISLITRGMKISGNTAEKIMEENDFDFFKEELLLYVLLDGVAWIDVVRQNDNIYLSALSVQDVKEVQYDVAGNITKIILESGEGDNVLQKIYTLDEITIVQGDNRKTVPNVLGFIPVVEIWGLKSASQPISRIEGLIDKLDLINEYYAGTKSIGKLHSDPLMWGNAVFDSTKMAEKFKNRTEGEVKYAHVPEGGKLQFLEMQGNVMKIMCEERDKLIEQVEHEYPELMLIKLIQGAAVSGYAISLKLTGLESLIQRYRSNYKTGLIKAFQYAFELLGINDTVEIQFDSIIPDSIKESLDAIISAYSAGLLDIKTAVKKTAKIFNENPEQILQNLQAEDIYEQQFQQEAGEVE